jgi:hypothetical protein
LIIELESKLSFLSNNSDYTPSFVKEARTSEASESESKENNAQELKETPAVNSGPVNDAVDDESDGGCSPIDESDSDNGDSNPISFNESNSPNSPSILATEEMDTHDFSFNTRLSRISEAREESPERQKLISEPEKCNTCPILLETNKEIQNLVEKLESELLVSNKKSSDSQREVAFVRQLLETEKAALSSAIEAHKSEKSNSKDSFAFELKRQESQFRCELEKDLEDQKRMLQEEHSRAISKLKENHKYAVCLHFLISYIVRNSIGKL